jgi:hypothetical protein
MFFINPFAFASADGDYESIETVTLSNSTTASVTFSSLSGYQHLQIRGLIRNTRAASGDGSTMMLRLNSDTGSNYFSHRLRGNGSSASSDAQTSASSARAADYASDSATASVFTAFVIDILDYADSSKNTTIRSFHGADFNGSGYVNLMSAAWNNTNAVTSITLLDAAYNFKQYSTLALYGLKAPA